MYALRQTFSLREKAASLLSNLERLKEEKSIEEEQYNAMKQNYTTILEQTESEIRVIKGKLQEELIDKQRTLEVYGQELKSLEARYKVGELAVEEYLKAESRAKNQIKKSEERIAELKSLIESQNSADMGGYIDVPLKRESIVNLPFAHFLDKIPDINFFKFSSAKEWEFNASRIATVFGVGLMFISVFMPWISAIGLSAMGIQVGKGVGVLFLILALVNVVALFLADQKLRKQVHIYIGAIGILGVIIVFFVVAQSVGSRLGLARLSIGAYLYFISCIITIICGLNKPKA
jgi:hypothetical protein